MTALIVVHAVATWFLAGLGWVVQVVHYPSMACVAHDTFPAYHEEHSRRIGAVVIAPMLVEAVTALALVVRTPAGIPPPATAAGLGLVILIWLSTAFVQVPAHRRLAHGFDPAVHRALVRGNWIRTLGWSARAILAAWLVGRA